MKSRPALWSIRRALAEFPLGFDTLIISPIAKRIQSLRLPDENLRQHRLIAGDACGRPGATPPAEASRAFAAARHGAR